MNMSDGVLIKKMEMLLRVVTEASKFGENGGELSSDDLECVLGGVSVPDYQVFLQYVRERNGV